MSKERASLFPYRLRLAWERRKLAVSEFFWRQAK